MRHFFAEMPHNLQFYRAVLCFIDNVICHQRIIFSLDINFYGLDLFLSAIAIGFLAHLRDLGKGILAITLQYHQSPVPFADFLTVRFGAGAAAFFDVVFFSDFDTALGVASTLFTDFLTLFLAVVAVDFAAVGTAAFGAADFFVVFFTGLSADFATV